jgi:hypothetical protein
LNERRLWVFGANLRIAMSSLMRCRNGLMASSRHRRHNAIGTAMFRTLGIFAQFERATPPIRGVGVE